MMLIKGTMGLIATSFQKHDFVVLCQGGNHLWIAVQGKKGKIKAQLLVHTLHTWNKKESRNCFC
jgi:hypothetical protein